MTGWVTVFTTQKEEIMSTGLGFQASASAGYNDKPPSSTGSGEADIASDPASSGIFSNDYKK